MKMNTVGIEPRGIVHIPIDAFFFFYSISDITMQLKVGIWKLMMEHKRIPAMLFWFPENPNFITEI